METGRRQTYSVAARRFHWWTVAALTIMVPLGFAMSVRGNQFNIWDSLTNAMYSGHKMLGVVLFFLVAVRLLYRMGRGAPDEEPTIGPLQRRASRLVHWGMYILLLATPVAGWFGVQLYPALDLFGPLSLPAVVAPDKAASAWVLELHGTLAFALLSLVAVHVATALFHHLVRKDRVLQRMAPRVPALKRR